MYDVITLGETMLRLTPPDGRRLEQAAAFQAEVGGSESNTAIGLARLGLPVAWLSRLPDTPLGRLVARTVAAQGVETRHTVWADEGRLGLYFYEEGAPPRGGRVLYDRAGSAMSLMRPDELPAELFLPGGARLLHLTGITPALGPGAAATALRALQLAREAGWSISFDLNYRAALWSPAEARDGCAPFLAAAYFVFASLADVVTLYGVAPDDPPAALAALAAAAPGATVVLTLGEQGALALAPDGATFRQPAFPTAATVGRIGRGDAFVAGTLYGLLTAATDAQAMPHALAWGAAVAALKATMPGDAPLIDRTEVEALLHQPVEPARLRR